ncbi:hypothetical protein [Methylobrevis pamukkalensis]|uniref:hypothetical protein n=1 Tax=Methylobrevis pamukkalensis TaxID=1439726 RepID=UPI00114CE94A|nr:hypothetical protein [Methylobrevis pamukkalensis]
MKTAKAAPSAGTSQTIPTAKPKRVSTAATAGASSEAMIKRLRSTLARQIERVEAHFSEAIVIDEKGARTLSTLTKTLENLIDLETTARRACDDDARREDAAAGASRADDDRFRDALAARLVAMLGPGGDPPASGDAGPC